MVRSIGYSARARARRTTAWAQTMATLKRRMLESLGFALLLYGLTVDLVLADL